MEMFPSLKQQELDLLGLMSALKRKKGGGEAFDNERLVLHLLICLIKI